MSSCIFFPLVNALDGDALYSRIDPSDLNMVKMEANRTQTAVRICPAAKEIEALTFIFGYQRYQTKPVNSRNIEKSLDKERTHWNVLMIERGSRHKNVRISLCALPTEGVT